MRRSAKDSPRRRPLARPLTGENGLSARLGFQRRPLVLSLAIGIAVALISVVFGYPASFFSSGRRTGGTDGTGKELEAVKSLTVSPGRFTDVTLAAGIHFVHANGATGQKRLPETMGGGSAFFDFDGDGDQDLLLVNSLGDIEKNAQPDTRVANAAAQFIALYRNDGRGRFEDVTAGSGLDAPIYGMGVAVGDYDNDERIDLFVTAVGKNRLFRNLGAGKFADVTDAAGVGGAVDAWSTGCGWFDYDNDGDLDLFACNYLAWTPELDRDGNFRFVDGRRAYGRPQSFAGASPYLYRNDGSGQFTDVSQQSGLDVRDAQGMAVAKSLGVTFDDLDRDGWLDVLVANDTVANQYFHNRGNGSFEEQGLLIGIALGSDGNARGAMGIDAAYVGSGYLPMIAIGNFTQEMASLFVSHENQMQFRDVAASSGLGPATQRQLTFGMCYVDFDLDGRLDLLATNGHLEPDIQSVQPNQSYQQSPQLFWNASDGHRHHFVEVNGESLSSDFSRPIAGRGASYADIDADGDLDLLVTAVGAAPRLLRNDQVTEHHWLRFELIGTRSNCNGIGATVEVKLHNRTLRRRVMPTRSYLSQVELPLTFGLGRDEAVESVTICWPDGTEQSLAAVAPDRVHRVRQPAGPQGAVAASAETATTITRTLTN